MAWQIRNIENILEESLKEYYPLAEAQDYFSYYTEARRKLVDEILQNIKAIENDLTDHGPDHIANVLDNVERLLGDEISDLRPLELYFLCMITLFHDVGNIHGRKEHYDKTVILKIYDYVRNGASKFNAERNLVAEAASAHSGKSPDGSNDTLKKLRTLPEGLFGEGINLRKLAPILRFADELAEGPQRTSDYMLLNHKYKKENRIHHKYAQISDILIDKGNGRVAINYNIHIQAKEDGTILKGVQKDLNKLLNYTYHRIAKLDDERRYNKYYSSLLDVFRITDVSFNFHVNGFPCDIGLSELRITDISIPGEGSINIPSIDNQYVINDIIKQITKNSLKMH